MRKKLLFTIIFCFVTSLANAGGVIGAGASAAASCTTSNDSAIIDYAADGDYSTYMMDGGDYGGAAVAYQFTPGAKTITQYTFNLKDGAGAGSVTLQLYTDSGSDTLGSAIAGTDVSVGHAEIGAALGNVDFVLASTYNTAAATKYWIKATATTITALFYTMTVDVGSGEHLFHNTEDYTTNEKMTVSVYGCNQ